MNDKYTTFKTQVGIDEIASYLGYKLDRRAGVGRYIEMCLRDGAGRKTDSIIISHPSDKSSQTYFHRNERTSIPLAWSGTRNRTSSMRSLTNSREQAMPSTVSMTIQEMFLLRYSMPHAMSSSRQPIT